MLRLALPLLIGLLTGHPAEGAQASFGGLAALYVPDSPYRYRARVVPAVGASLTLAVFLGAITGSSGWAAALVAGTFAAAASFICQTVELSPPRELMFVMALLAATSNPRRRFASAARAAVTAAGAVLAWLISMAPALLGRDRPETTTIAAALAGIADLVDRIGSDDAPAARHAAVNASAEPGSAGTGRAQRKPPPGPHRRCRRGPAGSGAAIDGGGHRTSRSRPGRLDPRRHPPHRHPGRHRNRPHTDPATAPEPPGPGHRRPAHHPRRRHTVPTTEYSQIRTHNHQGIGTRLRAAAGRHSVIVPTAARIGIAVAAGFGLGQAFGIAHAFWIGLTACAVLQASNLRIVRSRFVNRMIGTILGVGIVYSLLAWEPPLIALILTAIVAHGFIESVITAHYGLAVIGMTVLALMLFHLGAPAEDTGNLIAGRLIDTALGAALALLLRTVLWPRATSARVPPRQATVLDSIGHVFAAIWTPDHHRNPLPERRRQLLADITALRETMMRIRSFKAYYGVSALHWRSRATTYAGPGEAGLEGSRRVREDLAPTAWFDRTAGRGAGRDRPRDLAPPGDRGRRGVDGDDAQCRPGARATRSPR